MKYNNCGFVRNEVMKYCNDELKTDQEQIDYLKWIKNEYETNPPKLDPNTRHPIPFAKFIDMQVEYRENNMKNNNEGKRTNEKQKENYTEDTRAISNELSNAQGIIIRQRNKIKALEIGITKRELEKMIDDCCRKKNGKINYSALGRRLGCANHTAKAKCDFYNIS